MALDFAAAGTDKVDHGSDASLDNLDPFTFMEWIYPQSAFTSDDVVGFSKANLVKAMFYSGTSGDVDLQVQRATTNSKYVTNDTPLTIDAWNFLAWTFDAGASAGEVQNIYVGSLTALATESTYGTATDGSGAATDDSAGSFLLGNRSGGGAASSGNMKFAVGIYVDALLTLAQIQSWQFRLRNLVNAKLYCHYGFNGTGTQPDLSGNGNNGTVTGAVVGDHVPLGAPFGFDFSWPGVRADTVITLPDATWDGNGQAPEVRIVNTTNMTRAFQIHAAIVNEVQQTINESVSVTINTAYGRIHLISDGTNWMRVD